MCLSHEIRKPYKKMSSWVMGIRQCVHLVKSDDQDSRRQGLNANRETGYSFLFTTKLVNNHCFIVLHTIVKAERDVIDLDKLVYYVQPQLEEDQEQSKSINMFILYMRGVLNVST